MALAVIIHKETGITAGSIDLQDSKWFIEFGAARIRLSKGFNYKTVKSLDESGFRIKWFSDPTRLYYD